MVYGVLARRARRYGNDRRSSDFNLKEENARLRAHSLTAAIRKTCCSLTMEMQPKNQLKTVGLGKPFKGFTNFLRHRFVEGVQDVN